MVAREVLAVVIFLFTFAFINMFSHMLLDNIVQGYNESGEMTPQMEITGVAFMSGIQMYDLIIVVIMVILLTSIGVVSRRVASAPVFFVSMLVMGIFLGFISYFFNVLFINIVSNNLFTATQAVFPRTMRIATNLHWIGLAAIIIGSIAMYGKKEKGQFLA